MTEEDVDLECICSLFLTSLLGGGTWWHLLDALHTVVVVVVVNVVALFLELEGPGEIVFRLSPSAHPSQAPVQDHNQQLPLYRQCSPSQPGLC